MSDKIDFTTLTASGTSITLPAGKWLVTHTLEVGQNDLNSIIALVYVLTNFPGETTVAGGATNQNLWETVSEIAIMSLKSQTVISRKTTSNYNTNIKNENWTAVKIGA